LLIIILWEFEVPLLKTRDVKTRVVKTRVVKTRDVKTRVVKTRFGAMSSQAH